MPNLARQIKKTRYSRSLSQVELSRLSGVNYNTLIKIESGQITNPTISSVTGIANALNISLDALIVKSPDNKAVLGQIFTRPQVAKLMTEMLHENMRGEIKVLDPCIGNNIFMEELTQSSRDVQILGIEIDEELITRKIKLFYKETTRKLIIGDFFEFDVANKFDRVIMNPPYVRQEELIGSANNKTKITRTLAGLGIKVSPKSNLYIYFILKALKHLKKNGKLIVIVYDSWLYSDYGKKFIELITSKYTLNKIIHFEDEAFDGINVGATVVEIENTVKKINRKIQYIKLERGFDLTSMKENANYETLDNNALSLAGKTKFMKTSNFFCDISDYSDQPIRRGTSAIINKYFLFDDRLFTHALPIVKDIKRIKKMSIDNEIRYILSPESELTLKEKKYLEDIKQKILLNQYKYRSVRNRIIRNSLWYKPRLIDPGDIVFNYYFRNNLDFILNSKKYYSADNFYNLYINRKYLDIYFAILNSSFTKISLFESSKPQGKGLRKLQLNKFRNVKVINAMILNSNIKDKLAQLGKELSCVQRNSTQPILEAVDNLLIPEYNKYHKDDISYSQLTSYLYNEYEN